MLCPISLCCVLSIYAVSIFVLSLCCVLSIYSVLCLIYLCRVYLCHVSMLCPIFMLSMHLQTFKEAAEGSENCATAIEGPHKPYKSAVVRRNLEDSPRQINTKGGQP